MRSRLLRRLPGLGAAFALLTAAGLLPSVSLAAAGGPASAGIAQTAAAATSPALATIVTSASQPATHALLQPAGPAAPTAPPIGAAAPAGVAPAPAADIHTEAAILMYHHIAAPPKSLAPADAQYFVEPATFERQIFYLLSNGYSIVPLERVVDALDGGLPLPPKSVAITIDDGWQDFWNNGLPIANKWAIPVTLFAIADDDKNGYMTPAERWALAHSGLEVEAHTLTHPHLTKLLPAMASAEIDNSKKNLEHELNMPVPLFAYPYGDFNAPVEAMVKAAGYRAAFAAGPYSDEDSQHLYQLPRVAVSYYDTADTFAHKVADYRWARTHFPPMPAARPKVSVSTYAPSPTVPTDADESATRLLNDTPPAPTDAGPAATDSASETSIPGLDPLLSS